MLGVDGDNDFTRQMAGSVGEFTQSGPSPATYQLSGTVFDDDTSRSTGPLTLTVHNAAPIIQYLTPDTTLFLGDAFSFGAIVTDPGNDALSYYWDLDEDGYYDDLFTSGDTQTFGLGEHNLNLLVRDADGAQRLAGLTLNVIEQVTEAPAVPEPSTFALLSIGGVALVGYGWRKRRNVASEKVRNDKIGR